MTVKLVRRVLPAFLTTLAMLALISLSACNGNASTTPVTTATNAANTALVAAADAVTAADKAAALYVALPLCGLPTSPAVCSVAATSAKIQALGKQADKDLQAAEAGTVSVETVLSDLAALNAELPAT